MIKHFALIPFLLLLTSCAHLPFWPDRLNLNVSDFSQLNNWNVGDKEFKTFSASCKYFLGLNPDVGVGKFGTASDWQNVCAKTATTANPREYFENYFIPYLVSNNGDEEGLFTGYHEMELTGSLTREGKYIFPLYKKPNDLIEGEPYLSREVINNDALEGKGLELVYLDDPVKLFFLHIQGSGLIRLQDGKFMRVGFAAKNNLPYFPIGRHLADEGYIDEENISADTVKEWLYANPEKAMDVMQKNPSYIFFRELSPSEEAVGAMELPLTPQVSLAVDKNFIPLGLPLWVETTLPDTPASTSVPFEKLMVAQDTGSAIKGPVRGDIYFGRGEVAETLAGYMKQPGRYFLLLPKTVKISE